MKTLFDAVDRMSQALSFHRDRHTVLAGNLANLDTPGYHPLDLARPDEAQESAAALTTTNPAHLQSATATAGNLKFDDGGPNAGADGNAVNLEREMAKIAANRVRYATSSELVSRRLALLRYTSTDGGG